MIVQRVITQVKRGRRADLLALWKSKSESVLSQATKRMYLPNIVPDASVVAAELEFEDLAELEKTWAAWWADPDTPAFMEEYNKLVESVGSEVWTLAE